jgi:hypothetical protein
VSQRYENREKTDIECIYFFPVEEEAAVVEFIATLDGREIKSQVRERERHSVRFVPEPFVQGCRSAFHPDPDPAF